MRLITFEKTHSGFMKPMTKVSCQFEKSKQEAFTHQLDCRYHMRHCTAVNPKLHWVGLQADAHQGLQLGVGLQVPGAAQVESLPGTEQGRTGEKKILQCSLVSILSAPTHKQGAPAFPVPGNPVTGQSFQSGPARQQPCLCCSLLHLPR